MSAGGRDPEHVGAREAFVRAAEAGTVWRWIGGESRFLALGHEVGDGYMMEASTVGTGGGPEPHVQTREDEFFFVLDGGPVVFTAGNQTAALEAGGFITIRSGTAHHFTNRGAPARMLRFNAPAGFDRFQIEGAGPWNEPGAAMPGADEVGARLRAVAPAYGISLEPDPVLFERAPEIHVARAPGEPGPDEVTATVLAEAGHTGGRYTLVHVWLRPGARLDEVGHAAAATGLCVLAGEVAMQAGSEGSTLTAEGSAFLQSKVAGSLLNAGAMPAALLLWRVPGLDVPLRR